MKMKISGKSVGIPLGLAVGELVSMIITVAAAAVAAWLIATEKIGEGGIGYAATIITALAAAVGAWVSSALIKRMRLQICMLSGVCYFLILLALTALLFGGQYRGIGLSAIVILCACALIALLPSKNKGLKMKKKIGNR